MNANDDCRTTNKLAVILIRGFVIVIILALFLNTYLSSNKPIQPEFETTPPSSAEPPPSASLNMTPDQFKEKFNHSAIELDSDLRINTLTIQYGVVQNIFRVTLTNNLSVLGTINPTDSKIRNITVLGNPTGAFSDTADALFVINILIHTFDPTLSNHEREEIFKEVFTSGANAIGTKSIIKNQKRYFFTRSSELGIMFTISSSN